MPCVSNQTIRLKLHCFVTAMAGCIFLLLLRLYDPRTGFFVSVSRSDRDGLPGAAGVHLSSYRECDSSSQSYLPVCEQAAR